jgi:hypothetical protein
VVRDLKQGHAGEQHPRVGRAHDQRRHNFQGDQGSARRAAPRFRVETKKFRAPFAPPGPPPASPSTRRV